MNTNMNSKRIYLSIPYTKVDKEESFRVANQTAAFLISQGYLVFSPISMTHEMAVQHGLPVEWDFWKELDESFIQWADELYVCVLDGWLESTGVQAEIKIAGLFNKPVRYITQPSVRHINTEGFCNA